jgi:hypothetical protein
MVGRKHVRRDRLDAPHRLLLKRREEKRRERRDRGSVGDRMRSEKTDKNTRCNGTRRENDE